MGFYYPRVVYRNLRRVQGRYRSHSFLLWLTLMSWITCTAGQGLLSNCNVSLTGSGVITTPNYPLNYSNELACTWHLQSSSNATNIRLQFNSFQTDARWDVLNVYDEKGIVRSFSGNTLPPLMTLGRTARLFFTTDRSTNSTAFYASFTSFDIRNHTQCTTNDVFWCIYSGKCINRDWRCDRQWDCSQGEDEDSCVATTIPPPCGGTLVGSGTIQSPNYPQNYSNNARCSWRLLSRSNDTGIKIQFTSFTLENSYDYVTVFDERNISTRYTGNVLPPTILAGKEARIEFSSDGSNTMQGFTATFVSIPIPPPCGVTLVDSGTIQSPNYPKNYPNNARCSWRLFSRSNDTGIKIQFTSFNLENNYDYVTVYDERNISTRYTGNVLPPTTLAGKEARIEFSSDGSNTMQGFTATFVSIPIPPPCGGTIIDSGSIQSPYYPLNYPNNARCSWRLLSKSNDTGIRIQFNLFNLENSYDYVTVYDERNISTRYTGNALPPTTLAGKEARIEFYSDDSRTMQGFTATFVSISITSQNQCMTSDTFWCTSSHKCISSNWRCNGYADCMFSEDELLCPSTTTTTAPTTLSPQIDCQRLGKFWCSRSVKCVPSSYRCDNYNDCVYGEDEVNCTNVLQQQCQQSLRFWCGTSRQCISYSWKCDSTNDCRYGEDEEGCAHLSTETITAIAAGSVCGVVLFVLLLAGLIRFMTLRRLRQAHPRSNNYLQTTARPSATVWSTPATYASQFGAPNRQGGGPPGAGGLPMDQYAPPSYDATIQAYATGQYAYPVAQSGDVRPSSNTPAFTARSPQ